MANIQHFPRHHYRKHSKFPSPHKKPAKLRGKKRVKVKGHNRSAKGGIPQPCPFIDMLQSTPVSSLLPTNKQIVLDPTNTIRSSLLLLSTHDVIFAPLCDLSTSHITFLGFVCVMDVLAYLVHRYDNVGSADHVLPFASDAFHSTPVSHLLDFSRTNQVNRGPMVHKNSPLWQALGVFQKRNFRLGVLDDRGKVVNVLTRIRVLHFLEEKLKLPAFKSTSLMSLLELGLGNGEEPVVMYESQPVIYAFRVLNSGKADAVAVVDVNGKFVAGVTAEELLGTFLMDHQDSLSALRLPIRYFLEKNGRLKRQACILTPTMPLYYVLLNVIGRNCQIIAGWVLDEEGRPKGLITITALIRAFLKMKQEDRKV